MGSRNQPDSLLNQLLLVMRLRWPGQVKPPHDGRACPQALEEWLALPRAPDRYTIVNAFPFPLHDYV